MRAAAKVALVLGSVLLIGGCRVVDNNEHCVVTSYGAVKDKKAGPGINSEFGQDFTCFSLAQQNFPGGRDEEDQPLAERITATTRDRLQVTSDIAVEWGYNPAYVYNVWEEKRSPEQAEIAVHNAIREGYRVTLASWGLDQILSPEREMLGVKAREVVQRKLGDRYTIHNFYVRDIALPAAITKAQEAAIQAERDQVTAVANFKRDSVTLFQKEYEARVNAEIARTKAQADAEAKRLQAQAYATNPALLQLEVEKARAAGMQGLCRGTQNCYLGTDLTNALLLPRR